MEKPAPAPKRIYQITLWLADTGNGVCAHCQCVFVCVCVFPFKCCRCDTFITGDINELKLKLWKGTRGKKWVLTMKKRGAMEKKEKRKVERGKVLQMLRQEWSDMSVCMCLLNGAWSKRNASLPSSSASLCLKITVSQDAV